MVASFLFRLPSNVRYKPYVTYIGGGGGVKVRKIRFAQKLNFYSKSNFSQKFIFSKNRIFFSKIIFLLYHFLLNFRLKTPVIEKN